MRDFLFQNETGPQDHTHVNFYSDFNLISVAVNFLNCVHNL